MMRKRELLVFSLGGHLTNFFLKFTLIEIPIQFSWVSSYKIRVLKRVNEIILLQHACLIC